LVSICCFTASDGDKSQDHFANRVMGSWPKPPKAIAADMYPAISGKVLVQSNDIPLIVPLSPLMHLASEAVDWTIDIVSSRGTVPFSARLVTAKRGAPAMVQLLRQKSPNQPKVVIVSITDALTILDAKGHVFGRLVQQPFHGGNDLSVVAMREAGPSTGTAGSNAITLPVTNCRSFHPDSGSQYVLEEASGKPARWKMAYNPPADTGSFMHVKWLPRDQVLATIEWNHGYLLIANNYGVDAVLVITCALGLLAFELSIGADRGHSLREEPTSTAAILPERLQHR